MTFKRLSTVLIALTMTACITSCGDNDEEKSSSKSSAIEAQTAELSTVDTTEKVETTTIDEIQKALEEQKKLNHKRLIRVAYKSTQIEKKKDITLRTILL